VANVEIMFSVGGSRFLRNVGDYKSTRCHILEYILRLCTGRTAHRGSRGIAVPFLDHGTRGG